MNDLVEEALILIENYVGIDGTHHKQWLIDQIVRKLTGPEYAQWILDWEEEDYEWDTGIAP